jgi:hypothetical protein
MITGLGYSTSRLAAQLRLVSSLALMVTIPVVFYFTTQGTWSLTKQNDETGWSGGFYWRQAESMLVRARLDVEPTALIGECFERGSRCYGYFGLTPSLVRLPFLGINRFFHSALTPLFLAVAILVAYWAALQMLQRSLREHASMLPRSLVLSYAVTGALALGPGSTLLFVARPAVYEEAIAWAVAFFLLALNHVWAWHAREARSLVPAVIYGVMAANARPTAATACGVLGLVAAGWCWQRRSNRRVLATALCLSLLPGLTAAGVFWLKLKTPIPSILMNRQARAPHWVEIMQRNGRSAGGLIFTPTALTAYFRPDTVIRRPEWPFFDFRFQREFILWVPPLPPGGAYVERPVSVTTTMPLPWIVTPVVAIWLCLEARRLLSGRHDAANSLAGTLTPEQWTLAAGLLASAAAMTVLTVTNVSITSRYVCDFFPTSVVGVALAPRVVLPFLSRHPILRGIAGLMGLFLLVWSILVNLSLAVQLVFHWS